MKTNRRTLTPAKDILLGLFKEGEAELAGFLLRHTYFISPDRIRQRCEQKGSAAWFPDCVRASRQYHKGKQRNDVSEWEGRTVNVCDNTKARLAFASFSGLQMAGDKVDRIRGYHVAHIWERVYDPECFTAGWNLCLIPGFLKLFTEQQDRIPLLHRAIQQAAFDLYFKGNAIGLSTPSFITDPGLNLNAEFSKMNLNLLPDPVRDDRPPILLSKGGSDRLESRVRWGDQDAISTKIRSIREQMNRSWSNLRKGCLDLLGREAKHSTPSVAASSKAFARKVMQETGLTFAQILEWLDSNSL